VLGKEHPDTLTSMNDLAQALSDQRDYVEAEKMHRETLALREKVLGKEHPHTLTSINNLALALTAYPTVRTTTRNYPANLKF